MICLSALCHIYYLMRVVIYELMNSLNEKVVGPLLRQTGRRLYEVGSKLEGETISEDRVTPSLRKLSYGGKEPFL